MKKPFKGVLALIVLLGALNSVAAAGNFFESTAVFESTAADPSHPTVQVLGIPTASFARFGCGINGC